MVSLYDLAVKYSADKFYAHSYVPIYNTLFHTIQVKRLLEIGIGYEDLMTPFVPKYVHGASLKMWEEFLPEAEIFACDIREDALVNEGRIASVVCDQSQPLELLAMVGKFGGSFDMIIDDGSHLKEHQIITAITLLPYLATRGVYVIEDCYPDTSQEIAEKFGGEVFSGTKRADDNLVVIRR